MKINIKELYDLMHQKMGVQNWWKEESPWEIILGAILIQNTNQKNVLKSLENLREATKFDPYQILNLSNESLVEAIRPSGFYQNKAKSIKAIFAWLNEYDFEITKINGVYQANITKELLKLHGIGSETGDVIAVYVFNQVEFIADSYARRLFNELGLESKTYQELKSKITLNKEFSNYDAQEFHALIDEFGKIYFAKQKKFNESFLNGYSYK